MKTEPLQDRQHRSDTTEAHVVAVERAIDHMKRCLEEPLGLEEISRVAAISKYHVVRVFSEVTGVTPHHFLACLRVQRAKELLLNSTLPITEVCLQVGYSSLGSFSSTFSSLVGVSPQQFRTLPKRLTPSQFAKAIWHFLAADQEVSEPCLEGVVEGPRRLRGFTFVGAFPSGAPQGMPSSGTVLLRPGKFRIQAPELPEFHLLAAFIPLTADLSTIVTTLPVRMVAGLRVSTPRGSRPARPCLRLRPLRLTDPPIVLALPALSPWRGMFAG